MADTLLDAENYVAEFKGSGLLFEQALAQTDMAVCISNPRLPDNPIVFVNEAFLGITGYRLQDVLGRNCRFLQGAGTNREHIERLREAIRKETSILVELLNYRKDGSSFWNALHVGPVYDEAGELIYFFGAQMDVTDVHLAREAASEKGRVSDRLRTFVGRLGELFTSGTGSAPTRELSLLEVVEDILSAYHQDRPGRYSASGPSLLLSEDSVGAIGLCLHELSSRAVRDGVWSKGGGHVAVRWETPVEDCLTVKWIEDVGADIDTVGRMTPVLDTIVDSLNGSLSQSALPGGREVILRIPLSDEANC